ncbi:MAG: hypothetical protein IJR97_08725 [Clostridia bacterium]|nr:hypothetical protein [Clostridia bacterium]
MSGRKHKKRQGAGGLFILFYLLIGAACGVMMIAYIDRLPAGRPVPEIISIWLLMLMCVYGAMTLQIIIHEAGHLVFGLATGYRFSSFRVFGLMWMKQNGEIRLKKLNIAGTGGQCLMAPPEMRDGKMPVMLYDLGGVIMNLVSAPVFLGAAFLCPAGSFGRTVLLFPAVIGAAFALMNGLPLGTGTVNNDGMNALELARSPEAVRAFWIQMKVNEKISEGVRVKDMPEEWFVMPSDEGMRGGITAAVGVLACGRLMDEQRFEEAERLMARVLRRDFGVAGLHRALLTCDRMYVELIGPNRRDVLDGMLSEGQRKLMRAMRQYPSVLRTEYALALLGEKDVPKAETVRKRFDRAAAAYPYPGEIRAERELIALAALKAGEEQDGERTGTSDHQESGSRGRV